MRHGLPIAGNFLQQELAILTGAVEMMIVDVQCVMPSLAQVAKCFHTKLVSTSEIAQSRGAEQITFDAEHGYEHACRLIRTAIDNFERRDRDRVQHPQRTRWNWWPGFSNETIFHMLGGRFRSTFRPLNDAIIDGRIRGICGIVGCNNPKVAGGQLARAPGRGADQAQRAGAADRLRGHRLRQGRTAGAGGGAREGRRDAARGVRGGRHPAGAAHGLVRGQQPHPDGRHQRAAAKAGWATTSRDLPVAGAAPEWMSEKAVAIGHYFVASGLYVVLGHPFYVEGSENVHRLLCEEMEGITGGRFEWEPDPCSAAEKILDTSRRKRDALGINVKKERKLFDMKERRELQ